MAWQRRSAWLKLAYFATKLGMAKPFEEIRSRFHDALDTGTGLLALLVLAAAAIIVFFNQNLESKRRSGTPVIATITQLQASVKGKYEPATLVHVTAEDGRSLPGRGAFPLFELVGCKVGDRIRAHRSGMLLILEPAPCPISPASR